MKHAIYPEKQGTITASSEDGNYPATNLTGNNYRKKVWKAVAAVQTATLRVPISANAGTISLHNTNAETAICTITLDSVEKIMSASPAVDAGGGTVKLQIPLHGMSASNIVLINGTTNYDGVSTLPSQALGDANNLIITATFVAETPAITDTACVVVESTTHTLETTTRTYDRFWQEYTKQIAAHTATIKLTAGSGETVEAGIVRAGTLLTIRNPQYGASETLVDFSVKTALRNGALYTKKLEIVRSFSYSMDVTRESQFRNLMDLYDYYGPTPFAMLIDDEVGNDNMWCVFGAFNDVPSGNHSYPSDSVVSISILEAV